MIKVIIFILGFVAGIFTAKLFPDTADTVIENVKEIPSNVN